MGKSFSLLKVTPFQKLDKWYVEYYLNTKLLESKYPMIKIRTLISPIKRRVKKKDYDGVLPVVSKIVFKTGTIVFRKENKTGMDLFLVKKGDMLVSSINFHQGAVALNTIGDFVCSTHYQTFVINERKVIPEYLLVVLRSEPFISMVAGLKANGIKNESGFDFIGSFEIPLPSIPEQEKILKTYHETLAKAEKNIQSGNKFETDLLYDIQSKVTSLKKESSKAKTYSGILQNTSFAAISRWEVAYILKEGHLESVYSSFKYPSYCISQLQTESLFGLSLKASLTQKSGMIPMLRMPNIVNGEIDCTELKYLPYKSVVTPKEPQKWLLKKGDFLINRTNSKELVGKSAIFNLDGNYTYASYIIRYRFDTSIVIPEYVNIMFMLPLVRKQINAVSRQTAGQCNINSDEIGAIRIPVPSIPIQEEIIKKYNDTKNGANVYYEKAKKYKEDAQLNFESEIFS